MIGVHQVNINIIDGQVTVSYETPANLNSIEKKSMMKDTKLYFRV